MPFDGRNYFPESSPIVSILREGRRRVENSWFSSPPGTSIPYDGHCAMFAISRQNVGEMTMPALGYVARAIYGSDDPVGIQPWNDAQNPDGSPARTKEEVIAVYDKAIALAVLDGLVYAAFGVLRAPAADVQDKPRG
jgi:hypothetical protein